jgi:hypothetical protein
MTPFHHIETVFYCICVLAHEEFDPTALTALQGIADRVMLLMGEMQRIEHRLQIRRLEGNRFGTRKRDAGVATERSFND